MTLLDIWNVLKNKLSARGRKLFPKEREIWLVHLGQNIGHEQNGVGTGFVRPVLVLKKFSDDFFVALPLTTKKKKGAFYLEVNDTSVLILSQIKALDKKRFVVKKGRISVQKFAEVQKKSSELLFGQLAVDPEGIV